MFFLSKFLILFFIFYVYCNENCLVSDHKKCGSIKEQKYSSDSNIKYSYYLKKYQEAQEQYIPCNNTKCNCHSAVITQDLKPFQNGINKKMIDSVKSKGTLYQIIDGRIYRDKDCMFPARCAGIEHFLLSLAPRLSSLELVINTRDWPQINRDYGTFGPVFSFSKTSEFLDIMYPAWAFWEGGPAITLYPRGIGRWDVLRNKIGKVGNETVWEQKETKAFFRGSRTSSERDPLILLSREKPDLVDAQFTKNQAWKSDADTLHAPPAKEIDFADHCKYKYLFNFRGVAASFRLKHLFLCKSLVFHVGNEWLEFFYPALKPWVHYVPLSANIKKKEIENLLEFFVLHDDLAKEIAQNGYEMIWNNLKMNDVMCYWRKLLKNYGKLLKFTPELNTDLVEIRK